MHSYRSTPSLLESPLYRSHTGAKRVSITNRSPPITGSGHSTNRMLRTGMFHSTPSKTHRPNSLRHSTGKLLVSSPSQKLLGSASPQPRAAPQLDPYLQKMYKARHTNTITTQSTDTVVNVFYQSRQGTSRIDHPVNQDSMILATDVARTKGQHMFGVCDGHGENGHHVS
jgi:hypothetical protein